MPVGLSTSWQMSALLVSLALPLQFCSCKLLLPSLATSSLHAVQESAHQQPHQLQSATETCPLGQRCLVLDNCIGSTATHMIGNWLAARTCGQPCTIRHEVCWYVLQGFCGQLHHKQWPCPISKPQAAAQTAVSQCISMECGTGQAKHGTCKMAPPPEFCYRSLPYLLMPASIAALYMASLPPTVRGSTAMPPD